MTNRDDATDELLKALGQAEVPEGMEARIAQRLAQAASQPTAQSAAFSWREIFVNSAGAGAWWRGAISGATVAMLAVGAVMLAGHWMRSPGDFAPKAVQNISQASAPTSAKAINAAQQQDRHAPCVGASALRVAEAAPRPALSQSPMPGEVRIAISSRSLPANEPALTAQERELVRVVRVGNLKELATLNPEIRAKLEAEDAAQFQSFFAQPATKWTATQSTNEPSTAETVATEPPAQPAVDEPAATQNAEQQPTEENQ